ncbi:MAG: CRISPR-associated endonuclease Cas1 [Anaerolineae bacterium]
MASLYVVEQGAKLTCTGHRLVVEKDGQALQVVPMIKVSEVIVFGNVSLTTPAMKRLMEEGKDVVFLTTAGRYCGRLVGPETRHGQLRLVQYQRLQDGAFKLRLAQGFVQGKVHNMRAHLERRDRAGGSRAVSVALVELEALEARALRTQNLHSLRGVEGTASRQYFGTLRTLLAAEWGFTGRQRRPPPDPVNALLSFGYTLLHQIVQGMVQMVGLDPYLGFLHEPSYGRPSLALDLMEEFRPVAVDPLVLRSVMEGALTRADFEVSDDPERPVRLTEAGCRTFLRLFEEHLQRPFLHPRDGEQTTLRRCFEGQVRELARVLEGRQEAYRPFLVPCGVRGGDA